MIDVKTYAEQKGVSTQAVYKQINTHKKTLEGHIQRAQGKRWLDDEAVAFLNSQSSNNAAAIFNQAESEAIEELKERITLLQAKVTEQAEKIASQAEELRVSDKALAEVNVLLLNSAKEKERTALLEAQNADLSAEKDKAIERALEAEKTAQEASEELENEKTRKISFKEWLKRRK